MIPVEGLPADPRIATAEAKLECSGQNININWSHNYTSVFDVAWLLDHSYSHNRADRASEALTPPKLSNVDQIPRVSYASVQASETGVFEWCKVINE